MKFVFWQPVPSLHQAAFLAALAGRGHTVDVVARKPVATHRLAQGWDAALDHGDARLVIAPEDVPVPPEVAESWGQETIHVISGIGRTPFEARARETAVRSGAFHIGYVEPWQLNTLPRRVNWWVRTRRWVRRFSRGGGHFLTTGQGGVGQLRRAGVPAARIAPFAYWLSPHAEASGGACEETAAGQILYVGRLDGNKNIVPFARSAVRAGLRMRIVGSGPAGEEIHELAAQHPQHLTVSGALPNPVARQLMATADFLVLPSRYDGWGAVVSEALLSGTRVLVSSSAGAAQVVRSDLQGYRFEPSENGIRAAVAWAGAQECPSADGRDRLRGWAESSISADAGAAYLERVIEHWREGLPGVEPPPLPWW